MFGTFKMIELEKDERTCTCYHKASNWVSIRSNKNLYFYQTSNTLITIANKRFSYKLTGHWRQKGITLDYQPQGHRLCIDVLTLRVFFHIRGNKNSRDPIPEQESWSLSRTTTEDILRHASSPVDISISLHRFPCWIKTRILSHLKPQAIHIQTKYLLDNYVFFNDCCFEGK